MKRLLVTGSSGLVGSEICRFFGTNKYKIYGIDNNQRAVFFGKEGDTTWNQKKLQQELPLFTHIDVDIRDRTRIDEIIKEIRPDAVVHAAAQPSHDRAADIPFDDFDINATGTLNLLQAFRRHRRDAPFIFLSTNKVYGDHPNELPLVEEEKRWEFANPKDRNGIDESMSVDQCKHSLFGASKLAADIIVQEYGRYFDMPTCCLRGGCLTGPSHSGVELHGFLSYLAKCNLSRRNYTIFGYKGKQVRDNIHSLDVARFCEEFIDSPRKAEVYNLGGGIKNSCSLLEAIDMVSQLSGIPMRTEYEDVPRIGDHICYYSNLNKVHEHFENWSISVRLETIIEEIVSAWVERLRS